MPSSIPEGQYRPCINQARPLSAPAPQHREATTRARCHYRRTPEMTRAGARRLLLSRPRTRPSLAHVSRCGAFIGVRSHYRRARSVTPSRYRRVSPLSAHMRDTQATNGSSQSNNAAIPGLCVTTQATIGVRSLSAHVSNDAEPYSARQASIGTRIRQREPPLACVSNTARPLSARTANIVTRDPQSKAAVGTPTHYRPPRYGTRATIAP